MLLDRSYRDDILLHGDCSVVQIWLYFNLQGLAGVKGSRETGGSLALRALGRGSFYAFGGFSVFCFAVWKLSCASSVSSPSAYFTCHPHHLLLHADICLFHFLF